VQFRRPSWVSDQCARSLGSPQASGRGSRAIAPFGVCFNFACLLLLPCCESRDASQAFFLQTRPFTGKLLSVTDLVRLSIKPGLRVQYKTRPTEDGD
jgi:hypothetical protein